MKNLELKSFDKFNTRDVLKNVLETGGIQGITFAEMRDRISIVEKLESMQGEITLTLTQHNTIKQAIASFRFALADKNLFACLEHIQEGATDVPEQKPDAGQTQKGGA
jgi:hypothetical protein